MQYNEDVNFYNEDVNFYNEDVNFQLCKIDKNAIFKKEGKEINSIIKNAFNGGGAQSIHRHGGGEPP